MPQNALSTTASIPVPENRLRQSIVFTNIDTVNDIFLDTSNIPTITSANAGIKLRPSDSIAFNDFIDGKAQLQDSWQAIASAGTPTLLWFETEEVMR